MRTVVLAFGLFWMSNVFGQDVEDRISERTDRLAAIETESKSILNELEELRMEWIREQLDRLGYPKSIQTLETVKHSALTLGYSEKDEQAAWVQHIVIPEVEFANVSRTNDFRIDSLVTTGSAQETDYFLKEVQPDGELKYDGFGYDRGHLAPSADFRWSQKALSES